MWLGSELHYYIYPRKNEGTYLKGRQEIDSIFAITATSYTSQSYPRYYLNFSSRYSFNATALLNLTSFVPYSSVIGDDVDSSFTLLKIILTKSLFLSNSLKYLCLNSFHFFLSCPNHFLNELLGAISFCHKSNRTLSLLNPRGQSQSTKILKLSLFPFGLSYSLSTLINNKNSRVKLSYNE